MRKPIQLLFGALLPFAITLSLASCQRAELDMQVPDAEGPQKELREVIITADIADGAEAVDPATRTSVIFEGNKMKTYWSPNDTINVFSAGENAMFVSINTEPSRKAKFRGLVSMIIGDDGESEKDYVWGLYPYRTDATYAEPDGSSATAVITTTLPSVQVGKPGTFADQLATMIGRSETLTISYKNAYSGVYVRFNRNDIVSVTLKGRHDEVLAGRFSLGLDSNLEPEVKQVISGKTQVVITDPVNGTFVPGQNYFLVTLPNVALQEGYSLTVRRSDGYEATFNSLTTVNSLDRNIFKTFTNPLETYIENETNISNGRSTGWVQSTSSPVNEIWYKSVDNVEVPYARGQTATLNQLVENIPPSAANDDWGIMRFAAPVTETDYKGFSGTSLISVRLPETLETINTESFSGCSSLETIDLGSNLKTIKGRAIMNCRSLKAIDIPESVTSIGSLDDKDYLTNPFYQCYSLESFSGKYASSDGRSLIVDGLLLSFATGGMTDATYFVPSDVQHIGQSAFHQANIAGIVLPEGLITIQDLAFSYSSSLKSVTIPSTVEALYYGAFQRCEGLEMIKIKRADHVMELRQSDPHSYYDYNVFFATNNCPIYVPSNLLDGYMNGEHWDGYGTQCDTGNRYFSAQENNEIWYTTTDGSTISFSADQKEQFDIASCSEYGKIIFNHNITVIPESLLERNDKLETISLPDGVVNVLNNAFRYCSNLKDVSFGNRLQKIHVSAFAFCDLQSLVLPEGLIEISSNAFDGNTSLRSVRLPSSLVLVGAVNSFTGCTGLVSFSGASSSSRPMWSISSDGRCLIDLSRTEYIPAFGRVTKPALCSFATAGLDGERYVLPEGINVISNNAMYKCTFGSIQLAQTVTTIDAYGLGECPLLTNVYLPPGVTTIGTYAFYGCPQLADINIPASVTSIGHYAFNGCTNLRQIGMDGAIPPTLGTNVFSNTNDTFVIAIPGAGDGNYHDSVNYPAWYALRDHFRIYQPNNEIWYHLVGDEASHINFGGSEDFGANLVEQREIYVPRNKVGPLVAIPTEVETGNDDSFSIAVCVFDDKITKVPSQAFSTEFWNSKLDWVSIPGTVTEIGEGAFSRNSHLLDFPLYADYVLTSIGADAFNGCSSMKYDYIRSTNIGVFQTVTTIGDRAFRGCASLKSFSAPGVTSLGESAFHYCEGLQFVDLRSLTVVKAQTFYHCDALEAIRTGELTSIGDQAFSSCASLRDVGTNINDGIIQLPNITSLPQYAFYRCKKVEAIRLPNLTVAYGNAFGELGTSTTLQEFYVPKLANIIGLYVFGFIKMDELDLPSVTSIPKLTFGYSGIKTIRFGSSLSSFGGNSKTDMVFVNPKTLPERNLYFEGTTPPTFGTYAFFTDYDVCSVLMPLTSIHVPVGCKEAYKTALHNANSSYDDYFSIIVDDITVQ